MTRSPRHLALIVGLAIGCGPLLAGRLLAQSTDDRILLRLARPVSVGARVRLVADGSVVETVEQRSAGRWSTLSEDRFSVALSGLEEVRSVTANGRPIDSVLTVESFTVTRGSQTTAALPAGSVVTIRRSTERGAHAELRLGTAPLEESVAKALSTVITLSTSSGNTDAIFGAEIPRRPGERWAVPSALVSDDLERATGIEAALRGQARFLRIEPVEGAPCARLAITLTGRVRSMPNLPQGATITSATMTTETTSALPLDGSTAAPIEELSLTLDATLALPATPGRPDGVRVHSERRRSLRRTTLP